jgi:hypothetical protein
VTRGDAAEGGVTPGDSEAAANDPAPPGGSTTSRRKLSDGEARGGIARQGERASVAPMMTRGYLTLDTTPACMVSLGGVALGQTPLVKTELPTGRHVLSLSNPELGISSSTVVDIVAGVTMVQRLGLEPPARGVER